MTVGRLVVLTVLGLGFCLVLVGPAGGVSAEGGAGSVAAVGAGGGGVVAQGVGLCDSSGVAQFGDVSVGDYGAGYVLCMRALGLSLGTGDGTYGPDRELTRGQMASFLVRLWRDVLGRECPEGGTPFSDVAGTVHAANIECLYNLGITVGKTATSYAPRSDLTAPQISLFLFRTYEKAGRSCEDRASELDEAVACLEALRVIPSAAEGRSNEAVTRAQMAVYVIGLWHNLAGRGLPPVPPGLSSGNGDDQTGESPQGGLLPDVLPGTGRVRPSSIEGRWVVPVFVCGPEGRYTADDVRDLTASLNHELAGFFGRASSHRMSLVFEEGSVVSADIGWEDTDNIGEIQSLCRSNMLAQSSTEQVLLVLDTEFVWTQGGKHQGYGRYGGEAVVLTPDRISSSERFLFTVVHELAHSVLQLGHLKYAPHGYVFLNGSGKVDGFPLFLEEPVLACYQYEQLGWPVPDYARPCTRLTPSALDSLSLGPTVDGGYAVAWDPPRFSDNVPVTGYIVRTYRSSTGTGYASDEQPYGVYRKRPDARSHILDESIEPGTYFLSVRAISRYGEGDDYSVSFKKAPVPPPFGPIRKIYTTPTTMYLVWNTEAHEDFRDEESANIRYEVQYSANGMTGSVETWDRDQNFDTSVALRDLDRGTEYTIKVRACSVTPTFRNCTGWKTVMASTGSVLPPPDPITVLSGSDWYILTWAPVPGAESYEIDSPDMGLHTLYTPEYGSFHNVAPNTTYSLKVRSCSASSFCEGEWTDVTFTTTAEEAIPLPFGISLKEAGDSWVTVGWSNLGGRAWDYRVEYEYTDGVTDSGLLESVRSYSPLRLPVEPNRTYSIKIRNCELQEGSNSCSAWASFRFTFPVTSSVVPPSIRVTDIGDIWLGLSWDRVRGVVSYDWRYKKTGHGWWAWSNTAYLTLGLFHELEPNTTYTAEVRSCGKPTEPCSRWTATTLSTVRSLPPAPPSYPVSVPAATDTQIRVVWDQPQSDQHLDLKWYPTEERGRTIVRVGEVYSYGLAERVLSGLEPDTAYTIAVRTCRTGGATPCDNWVTIQATTRPSS